MKKHIINKKPSKEFKKLYKKMYGLDCEKIIYWDNYVYSLYSKLLINQKL